VREKLQGLEEHQTAGVDMFGKALKGLGDHIEELWKRVHRRMDD